MKGELEAASTGEGVLTWDPVATPPVTVAPPTLPPPLLGVESNEREAQEALGEGDDTTLAVLLGDGVGIKGVGEDVPVDAPL